jgi:hypothetical protein
MGLMLKGGDDWAVAFSGESRAWQAVLHNYQRIFRSVSQRDLGRVL